MDTPREREFKVGLADAAASERLRRAAGGRADPPVLQVNHFFDSEAGDLRAASIGLRLRDEGGAWTRTLKGPSSRDPETGLTDRAELEAPLPAERAEALVAGRLAPAERIAALLAGCEAEPLARQVRTLCQDRPIARIGAFRNRRTRVSTSLRVGGADHPVRLEFDQTEFAPGVEAFEVELELQPGDPEAALGTALRALFDAAGIEPLPGESKLVRFLRHLDRS